MRLVVAAVGKPRDRHLAAAIQEYETRATRYWPLTVVEVREASAKGMSAAETRRREGERLVERLPEGALVLACDERGDRLTSPEFASLLTTARDSARDVAFVIGGAYGLARVAACPVDAPPRACPPGARGAAVPGRHHRARGALPQMTRRPPWTR